MPSVSEIEEELKAGIELGPLRLRAKQFNARLEGDEIDALAEVSSRIDDFLFAVEIKTRSTPSVFQAALARIRQLASKSQALPLLLVPYLSESQLRELEQEGVSGVDLCGNGVIQVADRLMVYRSGNKNKYPDSQPTKYAYRGTTSLVARVCLLRRDFASLSDIEEEIAKRGSTVALSTVSKALKRLESDLIVSRESSSIRVQQPEKLLEKLADSYVEPKVTKRQTFSLEGGLRTLFETLGNKQLVVLNGQSSVANYAVMGSDEPPVLYCQSISRFLKSKAGSLMKETSRFVDIELQETNEPTVYFDRRLVGGMPYASPIQTYLALNAGDKRQQEVALQVKKLILSSIEK